MIPTWYRGNYSPDFHHICLILFAVLQNHEHIKNMWALNQGTEFYKLWTLTSKTKKKNLLKFKPQYEKFKNQHECVFTGKPSLTEAYKNLQIIMSISTWIFYVS